ncbi:MAG TPA: tetratricopeptide repeat protein [Terriglobales bacterium]|nr:tetratricopeptide repeat protein [Terriglobales bacterium]
MRAETRHQLKQDRFSKVTLEAAEKTAHWSAEHQSKLIAAAIAVVVVAAIAFGGWYYVNSQDEKASAELSTAVRTFETPVRPAGVPAQPGTESFASPQERATAARKQFQAIVDKYPRTHTADMARYFVGLASAQLRDNTAAERNLQEAAKSSNADLAALGKFALASVYRADNKDTQAVDLYKQLIDKPTIVVSKATAQLELAGFYESRQKPDEAKKIYDQVAKENPATEAASLAQRRATALKQ